MNESEQIAAARCVCDDTGLNCLTFEGAPGAVMTLSAEVARAVCDRWNGLDITPDVAD